MQAASDAQFNEAAYLTLKRRREVLIDQVKGLTERMAACHPKAHERYALKARRKEAQAEIDRIKPILAAWRVDAEALWRSRRERDRDLLLRDGLDSADPVSLLRAAKSIFEALRADDVEFTEGEEAAIRAIRKFVFANAPVSASEESARG